MSTNTSSLGNKISNFGTRFWALLLVVSAIVFAANFGYAQYLSRQETNARALTAELQVASQQLAKFAQLAVKGSEEDFDALTTTKNRIDTIINSLRKGSISPNVRAYESDPLEVGVKSALAETGKTWERMSGDAEKIIGKRDEVLALTQTANSFNVRVPQISAQLAEVVRGMSDGGSAASQINLANRQIVLADRMSRRVTEILAGGDAAVTAADALQRDAVVFGQVLQGLREGNAEAGVTQVTNPAAAAALEKVAQLYADSQKEIDSILQASTDLAEVQQSAQAISEDSDVLLENAQALFGKFGAITGRFFPNDMISIIAGVIALFAIIGLLWTVNRDQRKRLASTTELNQRNQEAILRLLDEMGSLAEGDLTVKATVTEDITGAIADSINFAVEALRSLVSTINETAVQVAAAAQETQATAMHLAEAAEHQAQQITSASQQINSIASSIDQVSKNSAESADVAQRSVQIAAKGADVVRQTIQGMDNIRDQIPETSKRIKRLGESSQEIGSIVELINDIAEQTNILALNAAIQAASAGEAGRGFAVVADEVQRLAERASNATKRIEALVQTIQSDTNEAVSSMEQTTAEVVAGARLAEDAGLALGEIEKVSNDLADLIQNISTAARQQSVAATNITATMSVIQEITTQTSHGASQTAESIGNLAQLAADLRRTVADFKLPEI
jgi:twitching motility protein PilJ